MLKVSVRVISNADGLLEIEDSWNTLVGKRGRNPLCLSGFIKQFMEFYRSRGWTPLLLAILADDRVVGIAPLMTKRKFGVRFVKFLLKSWFSPDFIVEDQYRDACITGALDFLFNTLRSEFVELTLPVESLNLGVLKQECKANKIRFFEKPDIRHCIIPIRCGWDEFRRSRGRNFRRKFKKIERNLGRAGLWRIVYVENGNKGSGVIKRILDVEKTSWKAAWRARRGVETDQDLLMILNGSQCTAIAESGFKWSVWFLELNDQTIAYSLVPQYKGAAFIIKTSYDERYKEFYPGIYVINVAIRELFNKRHVRNIDFLTDLPFHRTWSAICVPRVRIVMSQKGVLRDAMAFLFTSEHVTKILDLIQNPLLLRADLSS